MEALRPKADCEKQWYMQICTSFYDYDHGMNCMSKYQFVLYSTGSLLEGYPS